MALSEAEELEMLELEEELGLLDVGADSAIEEGGTPDRGYAKALLEEGPRIAGGVAGSISASYGALNLLKAVPHPLVKGAATLAASSMGAGAGGMIGEGATITIQNMYGMPEGSNSVDDVTRRLMNAGGEEALADAGGQVAFKILGRVFSPLKSVASKGVDDLQKVFQKYGGRFTNAQQTDAWFVHQLDGLTRGSMTGSGRMRDADVLNVNALKSWQDDLSNQIAATAKKNLTPPEFGSLIVNTIEGGKAAHRTSVSGMYSGFDELVATRIAKERITREVPTGIVGPGGEELVRTVTEDVLKEIRPVSLRGTKAVAEDIANKLGRIKDVGVGDVGKETLSKMLKQDETLTFADAQALRSSLLDVQRAIKLTEPKLAGNINRFVSEITSAMDGAAAKEGVGALAKYQGIKKFAKTGFEAFNDKFIRNILEKGDAGDFSKVGEMMFREGSADGILRLRRAMRLGAAYTKGQKAAGGKGGPGFDESWNQVKQGYLESFLAKSRGVVDALPEETLKQFQERAKLTDAKKMLNIISDPKSNKMFNSILNKKEKNSMFTFIKVAARVQGKTEGGLGMVMQLAQGGAIVGVASGQGFKKEAATIFILPKVLAKLMTTPKYQKILVGALTTPMQRRGAASALAQLSTANQEIEDLLLGTQRVPTPLGLTEQ